MKFPSVMKKPNPVEVMFKDKSKFDVQNSIVGSLIMQVVDNKKKGEILRALDQGPSIKDLDIEKRFRELKNFNEGCNNDDDDDNDNHQEVIYHCCNIRHHLEETNHHFHLHRQFRQRLL